MKKILACVHDKKYVERISAFCEQEHIMLSVLESQTASSIDALALIITDDKNNINVTDAKGVPVCIISNDKPEGTAYYLKENFSVYNLRMLVDNIHHGCLLSNYAPSVIPVSITKSFIVDNDYHSIDRAVCAMTVELSFFFSFSDLEKIRVGISEMITNAIEHGNLGITDIEKMESTENGTYYELLESRTNDPKYSNRRTEVDIVCSNSELSIRIKDDGDGFDTSKIPNPTDTERLLKLHGRGIFIAKMYFDKIVYNDKGNEVTLSKKL